MQLDVNGSRMSVSDEWADETLLMVLREQLGLTGAKFGCGSGECGTCVVHIDGAARRSCLTTAREAAGKRIVTIEGLARRDGSLHPVQQAWLDEGVVQCGYCQSGQIMQAAALLASDPAPDDAAIADQMTNLCRCGTYDRIRRAIRRAAALMGGVPGGRS
jgi:aerobic-type carbon monoxide dehydrogenase small subunit (CoxS/CutS family)